MNKTAVLVLCTLGSVLVMFALAAVVYPLYKIPIPDVVSKSMDALIVAFVAVLARTGSHPLPAEGPQEVTGVGGNPVETEEVGK